MTVEQALPLFTKIILKAQEEMKDQKQELEISILSESTGKKHKILPRDVVDTMTKTALDEIENEQMEL